MRFNYILITLFLSLSVLGAGTFIKGPALIEGFTTTVSAAGTTTLTAASETKQIVTGSTTQTIVMPDATTLPLGRKFLVINKSSGTVTVNANGGGLLGTISGGAQAEVHLRVAGSAAGTWDLLSSSAGGGGTWGSITGTLSSQTDLQTALNLKAPLASPTFTGTITTPLTASRALVTGASSELAASAVTATQLGYLGTTTSDVQTQLDAKQARSTLTTAGDIYVATASATTTRLGVTALNGRQLVTDSAATNKIRYKAPLVDNFIKNGDAESVTPISVYADAAGTRPVDCTGGSPNVTTSISSSSPLADVNSFTLVKDAANRQGQGWSIPFTIPASQLAKVLQIEVPYIVSSGTFVAGTSSADSDVIWYIYDVTNSTLIEPSSIKMLSNSTTISDKFVANFQSSATGTSYRLCAHVSTTSASAYTLKIDDIITKPSQYVYGTPITDWVSCTHSGTWSTNTTYTSYCRRVGDSAQAQVRVSTSGAPTAAALSITIPYTIDTAKIPSTTQFASSFGTVSLHDSGTAVYTGTPVYGSTTSLSIFSADATGSFQVANTNPFTFASGDSVNIFYTVPVVGWSSSVQVSDSYDARIVGLFQRKSTGSHTSTGSFQDVTSWDTNATLDIDDLVSFNKTTGEYIFKRSGRFKITSSIAFSVLAAGSRASQILYDGVIIGRSADLPGSSTSFVQAKSEGLINAQAGKIVKIQARQDSGGNLAYAADATQTYLIIEEIKSPTTISATELTQFYTYTGSPTGTLNGSYNTVTYGTGGTYYDTHGSYSAGVYTLRDQGCFDIKGSVQITHTTAAGFLDVGISFNDAAPFVADYKYVTGNGDTTQSISGSMCGKSGDNFRIKAKTNLTTPAYSSGAAYNYFIVSKRK